VGPKLGLHSYGEEKNFCTRRELKACRLAEVLRLTQGGSVIDPKDFE